MFYRKYRPKKFSDLINLEAVKRTLLAQLRDNKVGHAYLFHGPKGTGKTTTARLLAKALNCSERGREGEPCGRCENCQALDRGRFFDLIEIDAASNRGIDDIRALKEKIELAPAKGCFKIYIIDEAHMLTKEAFNALLKTLEEPPEHAALILCTTEVHKVPKTIVSRCQKFSFARASLKGLVERLETLCEREGVKLEEAQLKKIARAAAGGYRDAETLLEQVISGQEAVEDIVGLVEHEVISTFLDAILEKDAPAALMTLNHLINEGIDLEYFTKSLLEYLRDILLTQVGIADEVIDTSKEELQRLKDYARKLPEKELGDLITLFTRSAVDIQVSAIPQLPLEVAVVRYCGETGAKDFSLEAAKKKEDAPTLSEDHERETEKEMVKQTSNDIEQVKKKWSDILSSIRPYNHSIEALLRSCRPLIFSKGNLTIEAFYNFHKERINAEKNKRLLEKIASEVLQKEVVVKCVLGKSRPKAEEAEGEGIDIFTSEIE